MSTFRIMNFYQQITSLFYCWVFSWCIFQLSSLAELIWFSSATVLLVNPFMDFCIVSPRMVGEYITSEFFLFFFFFFPSHLVEFVPFFLLSLVCVWTSPACWLFENLFQVLAGMTLDENIHTANTLTESFVYSHWFTYLFKTVLFSFLIWNLSIR